MKNNQDKIIGNSFWANIFKKTENKDETTSILKSVLPFSDLKKSDFASLVSLIHHRTYFPDEVIFMKGDPGIALYIILEGEIKIELVENNINWNLAHFSKGDFFGELALLDNDIRSATAIAVSKCNLAIIFKPDLDEYVFKNPKAGNTILFGLCRIVTARLRNLNGEYFELLKKQ